MHIHNLIFLGMALTYTSDPNLLIEIGRLLKQARIKEDLPLKDMAKWLGMRIEQIQAIEDGNPAYFQKSPQSLIWFSRVYAKKLGVHLPELVFTNIHRINSSIPQVPKEIPAFLLKNDSS